MTATKNRVIEIHGHRGSRGTHPENTLVAFQEAVAAKADALELDMQLTKDDVVVISHDPQLHQLCKDAKGKPLKAPVAIRTLTLKQLKGYDCGSLANPRFPKQTLFPGTVIPTLEEVVLFAKAQGPQLRINIETKMVVPGKRTDLVPDPKHFVTQILAVLRRHDFIDRTILQSFDFRTLTAAKVLEPKLALSCLFEEPADFCGETAKVGAQWLSPLHTLLTPQIVSDCQAKGIKIVPWTANQPDEWKRLVELGVDAIISDFPRELAIFLGRLPAEAK